MERLENESPKEYWERWHKEEHKLEELREKMIKSPRFELYANAETLEYIEDTQNIELLNRLLNTSSRGEGFPSFSLIMKQFLYRSLFESKEWFVKNKESIFYNLIVLVIILSFILNGVLLYILSN